MKKLISIIMPAYNVENYIQQAIDSVINQNYENYELIIINDGSTDNTLKIINKNIKLYPNIKLINQQNQGLSAARKSGLTIAEGEYIYLMDSDDILEPNALNVMGEKIKTKKDCYVFNARFKNELDNDWGRSMDKKLVISNNYSEISNGTDLLNRMIDNREWRYAVWLYLTKKEVIKNNDITFFKNYFHEDSAYNYQLLNNSNVIEFCDNIIYNYRLRPNSLMSNDLTSKNVSSYLNSFKIIYNTNKKISNPNKYKFEIRIIDQILEVLIELSYEELKDSYEYVKKLQEIIKNRNYYSNIEIKNIFETDTFTFEFLESKIRRKRRKQVEDNLSYLEIHLADHCNLNCKGCCHFSPISEKKELSADSLEKDLSKLSELISGKLDRMVLLGGEPLLNKELLQILKICREYFRNTDIQLLTNGLLLLNESLDFWNVCRENNIQINITKYPVGIDYDKIINCIKENNIKYFVYDNGNIDDKKFDKYCFDLSKLQNADNNFYEKCVMAKDCAYLEDGKIYPCQLASNIKHFNKYFGLNIEQSENDYIDIHSCSFEQDIYEFLSHPIEFCKYCDFSKMQKFDWDFSKKEINEWLVTNEKKLELTNKN
ncbi:MAG: glycosyltransferase [Bacilli bacterium]|nr:glycosyltransferase [Bacilli bacterium]